MLIADSSPAMTSSSFAFGSLELPLILAHSDVPKTTSPGSSGWAFLIASLSIASSCWILTNGCINTDRNICLDLQLELTAKSAWRHLNSKLYGSIACGLFCLLPRAFFEFPIVLYPIVFPPPDCCDYFELDPLVLGTNHALEIHQLYFFACPVQACPVQRQNGHRFVCPTLTVLFGRLEWSPLPNRNCNMYLLRSVSLGWEFSSG